MESRSDKHGDPRQVAILMYEGAEVLDFAGPFEVFAVTSELNDHRLLDVHLVGASETCIRSVNGMQVVPTRCFETLRTPEILVVPGGSGSRQAMSDPPLLDWVARAAASAEIVLSVCSGARILGALGLLAELRVTTHHQVFEHLQQIAPGAVLERDLRFVDSGRIITTGGISAGIDGSFHVVARLFGLQVAQRTAAYMEYAWKPERDYPPG